MRSLIAVALLLAGCGEKAAEPEDGIVLLEPRAQLTRLSMDLRGVHPSEAELAAIEANPALYEQYVDRYLHDPRFLDRIEEIYNLAFLTRTGEPYYEDLEEGVFRGLDEEIVADSVNDEPLKLVRHIVENDLPYTEIVLADYTMADAITATLWGIAYPEAGSGWQQAHYDDGRPHRGVLTMTTMWARYPSAGLNGNRHRANNLSRILLCDDYLARPVSFSRTEIDAVVSEDPNDVIAQTPTCQSCHSSLDPLAAHFYGFWWEVEGGLEEQTTYRPEDEPLWRDYAGVPPSYFGRPTTGLEELAAEIATDERLVDCAVQTVFQGLTQRDVTDEDWTELAAHRAAFADGGLVVRDLVRSIVTSRPYLAGEVTNAELAAELPTVKMVSPSQLASVIDDLTGYRWTFGGRDGLVKNEGGLAVLSGGIDSWYVTTPSHDPSVGIVFVQERLAQAAAYHVAQHDLDAERTADAKLLLYVTATDTPDSAPEAFDAQIRHLYLTITGTPLPAEDAPEIPALKQLWKQLYSVEASAVQAWAGVVSVVLRDPAVLFY